MRQFFKSFILLAGIYIIYKAILFCTILFLSSSSYNQTTNFKEFDYGVSSHSNIVIAGSSNTKYNFNYALLNEQGSSYSFKSGSLTAPWGLYFLLKKARKNINDSDKVIFDLTYNDYMEDEFLPGNDCVFGAMTLSDYKKVFAFSPRILFKFLTQQSVFNPQLTTYFKNVYKNRSTKNKTQVLNQVEQYNLVSMIALSPDFKSEYSLCNNHYDAQKHRIGATEFNKTYLEKLKQYIDANFTQQKRFYLPEINKNNHGIQSKEIAKLDSVFHPLNSFTETEFINSNMYDQQYHLNKCGADINTLSFLKNLQKFK